MPPASKKPPQFDKKFKEFKDTLVDLSLLPVMLGVFIQLYHLISLNAVAFFSWTQAINESVSFGGIFLLYASVVFLGVYLINNTQRLIEYFHISMIIIILPWMLYYLGGALNYYDLPVTSTLQRSARFFTFVFCTVMGFFLVFRQWQKPISWSRYRASWLITTTQRIGLLALYGLFSYATYAQGQFYFGITHKLYIHHNDQILLVNYFNDKYIFSQPENGARTIIIGWDKIAHPVLIPKMLFNLQEGIRVAEPDNDIRQQLGAKADTPLVKNKLIPIVPMKH